MRLTSRVRSLQRRLPDPRRFEQRRLELLALLSSSIYPGDPGPPDLGPPSAGHRNLRDGQDRSHPARIVQRLAAGLCRLLAPQSQEGEAVA